MIYIKLDALFVALPLIDSLWQSLNLVRFEMNSNPVFGQSSCHRSNHASNAIYGNIGFLALMFSDW